MAIAIAFSNDVEIPGYDGSNISWQVVLGKRRDTNVPFNHAFVAADRICRSLWVHRPSWMWTVIPDHRDSSPTVRNAPTHPLERRSSKIYDVSPHLSSVRISIPCSVEVQTIRNLITQFSIPSTVVDYDMAVVVIGGASKRQRFLAVTYVAVPACCPASPDARYPTLSQI
ncbi:hypothetical protein BU17DRAFT_68082 [Hysterangium stoloniferum]|nr:hypothetical protein BU17DRAFT_68082 [Hysterangium stoloniferum]